MKKKILCISCLLISGLSVASIDDGYGTYYNEKTKVKIFYEIGDRGADEFSSSVCPKKIFKHKYIDELYWVQEAKKKSNAL